MVKCVTQRRSWRSNTKSSRELLRTRLLATYSNRKSRGDNVTQCFDPLACSARRRECGLPTSGWGGPVKQGFHPAVQWGQAERMNQETETSGLAAVTLLEAGTGGRVFLRSRDSPSGAGPHARGDLSRPFSTFQRSTNGRHVLGAHITGPSLRVESPCLCSSNLRPSR